MINREGLFTLECFFLISLPCVVLSSQLRKLHPLIAGLRLHIGPWHFYKEKKKEHSTAWLQS